MPYVLSGNCVHKKNPDGSAGEKVKCHESREDAMAQMIALNMAYREEGAKDEEQRLLGYSPEGIPIYDWTDVVADKSMKGLAVKVAGDWEIDILAIPFEGVDSDGQTFDANTDIMQDTFPHPAIIYHHGIKPGTDELQAKPAIIGKAKRVEKRADGWHVIALLDKAVKWAKDVWEAAKQGLAVASSDSIFHLVRLEVGGKLQSYAKNTPGRIAVWPLAGVSVWNLAEGNLRPASRNAIALPAMKAIYQEAGIPFPAIKQGDSENDEPEADKAARIARKNLQKQARRIISTWNEPE